MNEKLTCPSCSGQMDLGEFKPGDKIAKCPYCGTVVDLPDGPTGNRKVTRFSEKKSSLGGSVERSIHIVEEKTVQFAKEGDPGFDDLMDKVRSLACHLPEGSMDQAAVHKSSKSKNLTFSATVTSGDDSPGDEFDLSDLPEKIRDKVGDMVREMKGSSSTAAGKKKKKSWWKRWLGRE